LLETIDFYRGPKSLKRRYIDHDISKGRGAVFERLAPLRSVSFVQKYAELVAIRQNSLVKPTFHTFNANPSTGMSQEVRING